MSSLTTKTTKSRSSASPKSPAKPVKKTVKKENKLPPAEKKSSLNKSAVSAKVKSEVAPNKKTAKGKAVEKGVAAGKRVSGKKAVGKATAKVTTKSPAKPTAKRAAQTAGKKGVQKVVEKAAKRVVGKAAGKSAKAGGGKRLPAKAARAAAPAPVAPVKRAATAANAAAVQAFEQGLKLFNRHDYTGARDAFERILEKFNDQTEVIPGVRKYLTICAQKLARTPAPPKNADALYDQGVYELNRANVKEAAQLLEKALRAQPRGAHVLYSLAAAYARLFETRKALEVLRQAIQLDPVHRSRARSDGDFANLHQSEDFQQMTGFGIGYIED